MSLSQAEFQIPEGYREYPQPIKPIENEAIIGGSYAPGNNYLIDRGSIHYSKSAEIALENQARIRERQAIIGIGSTINRARQDELERRLNAPRPSIGRRVLKILTTGQLEPSAFRIKPVDKTQIKEDVFRQLVNQESRIGASLLDQSPIVSRQEFFLSDSHSNEWFLHMQSAINPNQSRTIRYAVYQTEGVVKSLDGGPYQYVVGDELSEFTELTKLYFEKVAGGLYKIHEQSAYGLAA